MRHVSVVALVLAMALSGCTQEPVAPPPVAGEPEDCVAWGEPWTQTMNIGGLTYYIGTPMGGMGGSRTYPIPVNETDRPLRIRFTAEWDAASPLYWDSIKVGFSIYEDGRISDRPEFEGTSPLQGEFELLDLAIRDRPTLALDAPRNYTTPVTARIAVVEHPITITLEQLHPCEATSRPG